MSILGRFFGPKDPAISAEEMAIALLAISKSSTAGLIGHCKEALPKAIPKGTESKLIREFLYITICLVDRLIRNKCGEQVRDLYLEELHLKVAYGVFVSSGSQQRTKDETEKALKSFLLTWYAEYSERMKAYSGAELVVEQGDQMRDTLLWKFGENCSQHMVGTRGDVLVIMWATFEMMVFLKTIRV